MGEDVGEGTEYITLQTVPGGISGQEDTMKLQKEIYVVARLYESGRTHHKESVWMHDSPGWPIQEQNVFETEAEALKAGHEAYDEPDAEDENTQWKVVKYIME